MAESGRVTAFYLFDVAEAIDLAALRRLLGAGKGAAHLKDKAPGPPRLAYIQPPVTVDGDVLGCAALDDFRVRVKFFDYGVVSLMLTRPFEGAWSDLVALGQSLIESEPLEDGATDACRRIVARTAEAIKGVRASFLSEDYLVFAITAPEAPVTADAMLDAHGDDIAQLLRGERQPLSRQEREEILRHRLSYLTDDLVVPAWNAAFVYDTEQGLPATLEILEFANSQLLEYRYHDDLLDNQLGKIYGRLQRPTWRDRIGGRYGRAAAQLHSLFIDVNELTDRTENAVKLVGDMYAVRLFGLIGARLGLERWKVSVEEKLKTLDDIYRFAVEQTGISQGNLLELVIILILVVELGLAFAGIMH